MSNLLSGLASYVGVLEASAESTNQAEDRSAYVRHLAEAAKMFAAIQENRTIDLLAYVEGEKRAYGLGFLAREEGSRSESAFQQLASLVEAHCDP